MHAYARSVLAPCTRPWAHACTHHAAQVREAQIPGYTGTMFSWAPALPSGGQGGQGGSGAAEQLGDGGPTSLGSGASAPYSDEGFLVYNVGDNLLFADQRSAASGEAQPEHEAVRLLFITPKKRLSLSLSLTCLSTPSNPELEPTTLSRWA